jgi:GAF domain-containing protein/CheY-like chemotaxis protein
MLRRTRQFLDAAARPGNARRTTRISRLFATATRRYAWAGAAFGCLFPIGGTLIGILLAHLPLSLASIVEVQRAQPLLWIIDTAPLFLGAFAAVAGRREEALQRANARLRSVSAGLEQSEAATVRELARRTAQLDVSAEVSRAVTSILDPDNLVRQVVQLIADRFNFYYAAVFLVDPSGRFAVLHEATGAAGQALKDSGHRLEVGGQSMVGMAVAGRKPRVAARVSDEPNRFANPLLPDTQSEIALPLIVGDRVLGVLDVQSTQPNAFDTNTIAVLQSLADQVAIALNNARQFQSAQIDARQATALFEASQLAGNLGADLALAAERLLATITRQTAFDRWAAVAFDADGQFYTTLTSHHPDDASLDDSAIRAIDNRLHTEAPTALAIRLRQPVIINDPEIEPLLGAMPPRSRRALGRSVSVPVLLGDRLLGAISLGRGIDQPDISPRDVQLAQAVASQLAVTMENQRLFEQARAAVSDLESLMRRYTHEGWAHFGQRRGRAVEHEFSRPEAAQIERDGQAVAIPISLRGEVIGVLGAQNDSDRRWSDDELITLRAVADQVAQSVEVARLLDETESSLHETRDLYEANRAMASAATPGEVMQIVVEAIHHRLQADQVGLVLFDPEQGFGRLIAEAVPTPGREAVRIPMAGNPTYELLAQQRAALTVYDVASDPATAAVADMLLSRGVRSILILPLLVEQRLIGSLGVDSHAPRRFLANEIAYCETLARQAAVAIENRRLFEETQRRAEIESALNRISQAIRASVDPQAVLDLQGTLAELGRVLRASHSYYLANDDERRLVRTHEWRASDAGPDRGEGAWSDAPQAFRALYGGRPLAIEDVERDAPPELRSLLRAGGVRAHLHVPVVTGHRLIGILGFDQIDRERRWAPEEISMAQRVADQLAAALENARLYQNVRARVSELTALTRIGRRLAATLDLDEVLNTIVEEALTITPANRGSIALYDESQAALDLRVLIGYPDETLQRIRENAYHLLRRGDGLHGRLLAGGQAVLVNDVLADPSYLKVDDVTRAELIVPIRQGETLLGALNLESPRPHAFGESDLRLIEALADQAAVAIVNARAYAAERAALERMREVDRLKTQFLANMSHELRTPLNSIIGFSRVILRGIDGPLTELQQADLTAIHNSGQHLLGLINDILDLSKIEAGKMELTMEDVDLAEVTRGVMSTAIALVKDRPVELRQELPADLPLVRADSRRIRQVVLNLVSNAAKFTEKGHITVRAAVHPHEVQVSVLDTGIGIPADKLEHIFEEFTQVDASTTRKAGGTGLGLAITRHFVEMHGGRIWVDSEVGAGSTFTFTLPLERPAPEAPEEMPQVEPAAPPVGHKRILCLDDDPGVITLYRRYLEKQGYQIFGVQDASQAVAEARRLQPAAITLDVLMPNQDGWAVLAELKSAPDTSHIPVIVCSIIEDESKGFALGAADYLVKPITESELLRALDRANHGKAAQTVLVIDDEADALRLIRRMLEARPGFQVIEAQGGLQGIASVQALQPDVVILDLMMPDIDGFAVLETIKSNRLSRSTPVIIVTAKELTEDDRARLRGQTAALLNKGAFDSERLLGEIASALAAINGSRPALDVVIARAPAD